MRLGCEAWLMLIQPATHVVAMEADMCEDGDMASNSRPDASCWESVIAEYSHVFEPPGMPANRDCKGSHPTLPVHHSTVVLRCSYHAVAYRPSTGVYIYT